MNRNMLGGLDDQVSDGEDRQTRHKEDPRVRHWHDVLEHDGQRHKNEKPINHNRKSFGAS
jgi:hypothetical protein